MEQTKSNLGIPKTIHYCWFGRNPLPEMAIKCIESWRKFFPDYEIIEWNEDNFDVNIIPYTQEAYSAKKYAFVSDYARFWILYKYGGLYFDTDVEVIKSMDDIISRGSFMGVEVFIPDKTLLVAPGLGLGAYPGLEIYREMMNCYNSLHFLHADGSFNQVTIVKYTSDVLKDNGLKCMNVLQLVAGVWIYPQDYFNPLDDNTGRLRITENTRSIHWYTKTWLKKRSPFVTWLLRMIHRCFGNNSLNWIKKIFVSNDSRIVI